MLGLLEALEPRLVPATFVVTSTLDQPAVDPTSGAETASGAVTLRSAIQAANAHPNDATGPDRIEFNIPGSGVQTIEPISVWPAISEPIVIDGYTQPGAAPNTLNIGDNAVLKINLNDKFGFGGLTITAGDSIVRGLVFTHFPHALTLTSQGGNVVAGNFFGLPASGGISLGNNFALYVGNGADANRIGGTDPADRNVISGNAEGIRLVASSENVIQGNYIGLDTSRNEPIGNGRGGIIVTSGVAGETTGPATGNLIGGTVAGARNVISGNGGGILFGGDQAGLTSGNLVQGNSIGTDAAGGFNAHFHNNGPGILLGSGLGANPDGVRMNTIGGTTAAARNVIVNSNTGIQVGIGATENLIQGNFIGTDSTGTGGFQNSTAGITVQGSRTTIRDNLISGNRNDGILIDGGEITLIQGNRIGTDANGTSSVFNQNGIHLSGANYTTIGGTTSGAGNVISGNQLSGILLDRSGVGNQIMGNLIGTTANGSDPLGNGVDGILINFNEPGSPSGQTLIGGADPGAGNVIAFNLHHGVDIRGTTRKNESDGEIQANVIHSNVLNGVVVAQQSAIPPHYRITRNAIFSNGRLAIDLGDDGVTRNDAQGHVGPNNFQNFPVITSATLSDTATTVSGTLQSTPSAVFRIEFFANAETDPSGHGEGQTFLGFLIVASDASGHASFDNVVLPPAPVGQSFVSVTATDGDGNTSEFSGMTDVSQTTADLAISASVDPDPVVLGGELTYTITVTNHGPDGADNVSFTTAVPNHSTFFSFQAPNGWTSTFPAVGDTGNVLATIAHLDSGATAVFSFIVFVDGFVPSTDGLTAIASATSGTDDPDTSNNLAAATAGVPVPHDRTDLAVAVSVTPGSVRPGQVVTYTITAANNGPIVAGNDIIDLHTPSHATIESVFGPSGWDIQTLPGGEILVEFPTLDVGVSMVLTVKMKVDASAAAGTTLGLDASIVSETLDSNDANNQAHASAVVVQPVLSSVAVAIRGDINPATVGQVVTYTVTVSNPSAEAAPGVVVHVRVPNLATLVTLGGGVRTSTGADLAIGTLAAGASRPFQIQARFTATGTMTLTAAATADPSVQIGGPASVSTRVVSAIPDGPPPPVGDPPPGSTPPPTVLTTARYGFHTQPTLLAVTFSEAVAPDRASDPANYVLLVTSGRAERVVPISRVFYNTLTHQATLRAAKPVYLYHPWRLVVRGAITDMNGLALAGGGDGISGRDYVTTMNRRNLAGAALQAPDASHVGVKAPAGPLSSRGRHAPLIPRSMTSRRARK